MKYPETDNSLNGKSCSEICESSFYESLATGRAADNELHTLVDSPTLFSVVWG